MLEDEEPPAHQAMYERPVFVNKARQVCAFTLPLKTAAEDVGLWHLSGTALLLDAGKMQNKNTNLGSCQGWTEQGVSLYI